MGLAQAIRSRGDTAAFLGAENQRGFFEDAGFAFSAFAEGAAAPGGGAFDRHRLQSWANPAHAAGLAEQTADNRCDVLVIDCLMFGALAAAEATGLPAAALIHSPPNALAPSGGGLDGMLLDDVNALRSGLGLVRIQSLQDAWRPFLNLCTSIAELDPPAPPGGPAIDFVGPVFTREQDLTWRSPWPADDPRPLVLVSFSTGRAWDQTSRVRRTLAALSGAPYRVLATVGEAGEIDVGERDNVVLTRRAPHLQVLAGASAMVTHCGHGSLSAALACGVPLVGLPNAGADQDVLSARIQHLGAGLALDGEEADAAAIRAAVDAVVSDGRYRAAAAGLAERVRTSPGAAGAIALLARLRMGDRP